MIDIENMFKYQGKTTKVIGSSRTKTYKEVYDHISSLQGNKLPYDGNKFINIESVQAYKNLNDILDSPTSKMLSGVVVGRSDLTILYLSL